MSRSIATCGTSLQQALRSLPQTSRAAGTIGPLLHGRAYASATTALVQDAPKKLESSASDSTQKKRERERLERIAKKEVPFLEDPWKLAQYVERAVKRGGFEEALLVTQKWSRKDHQVPVAWNVLIDHLLSQRQTKAAIKLYNDMKKRHQLPNVKTFTILFRGLIRAENPQYAVYESVKYYNVLLNDKRLEPNTIHLNAVLNVCAKAGDLDSMFLIADSINDGARTPDATTYSIILHALRHHANKEMKGMPPDEKKVYQAELVGRAKMIWADVIKRWNAGKIVIDEELVCIMGRLVLMSPKLEDKRQVLDLLNQTMSMPNLHEHPDSDPYADDSMKGIGAAGPSKALPSGKGVYATPGKNTISLVLKTLAMTRLTVVGVKYWNLMVRHYGIVPDEDNWMYMLHMLQVAKASAHAANILDIMPDQYLARRYFKAAMEACVRDNVNTKAIKSSNKILDAMMGKLESPDIHTLRLYLRASLVNHHRLRQQAQKGKEDEAKQAYGLQITEALARLWDPYKKVYWQVFKNTSADNKAIEKVLYNDKREVIALARQMFSAFNKVINEKMLPEKDLAEMRPIGAKINRSIQAFYSNREEREPNLKPKKSAQTVEEAGSPAPDDGPLVVDDSVPVMDKKYGSILEETIGDFKPRGDYIWDTTKSDKETTREAKRADKNEKAADKPPTKRGRPRKSKDEKDQSNETPRALYPWESAVD